MLITMATQLKVNKEHGLSQKIQTGGQDISQVIFDFDILLESVYPHQQFTEFLRKDCPEMVPYLTIIRKAKLLKAKQQDLDTYQETSTRSLSVISANDLN